MKRNSVILIALLAIFFIILLGCACLLGSTGVLAFLNFQFKPPFIDPQASQPAITNIPPTNTADPTLPFTVEPPPTATLITETPQLTGESPYTPESTLSILQNTVIPLNDPIELAMRLKGITGLPTRLEMIPPIYQIGDTTLFWVSNTDANQHSQIQATLRYATEHVYFWIEDGVRYSTSDLKRLVDTFEKQIYPTTRSFFGSEWTPGVDNDPHLFILYAKNLGKKVAGYFSPGEEYLPIVQEHSNTHEMFFLNADNLDLGEEFTYGVLAHEFQHMIHWNVDRNESTWVNEGLSNLASLLNGYSVGGTDILYAQDPDIQLTDWATDPNLRAPHYGASFLFMAYMLDRLGEEVTKTIIASPENDLSGIDQVLAQFAITDPLTGQTLTSDDIFADWVVATYLQDAAIGDGRYAYHNYPGAPTPNYTDNIRVCPLETQQRDVSQYGVDYIRIRCSGNYTLQFQGAPIAKVWPTEAYSGSFAFYSNAGDESDMTLTQTFDFTNYSTPLTLSYWTWYDLEKDFDYLYLMASVDDGKTWKILITPSGSANNSTNNSYGWSYTGLSGDGPEWIQEQVDLSQFAGQRVQLRFEYITDGAVNGTGFLLDDIAIPETGYFSDFEADDGGWQANGFVRIQNSLPQYFRVTLISMVSGTAVETIEIPAGNTVNIPLNLTSGNREAVLVVSGVTRFTRQKASYQFSILP